MLRHLRSNAYLLELPPEVQFSHIFNVEDFTAYLGHDPSFRGNTTTVELPKSHRPREDIEDILDDQVVSTWRGEYQKFLIKCKDRLLSDYCWLKTKEVQCLNPDILELYQSQHPSELDSLGEGEN